MKKLRFSTKVGVVNNSIIKPAEDPQKSDLTESDGSSPVDINHDDNSENRVKKAQIV